MTFRQYFESKLKEQNLSDEGMLDEQWETEDEFRQFLIKTSTSHILLSISLSLVTQIVKDYQQYLTANGANE